jgi:dihydropyrimidinase
VRRTLSSADLHGSDYSAWDGWEVHGWPETVLLGGKVVIDRGKRLAGAGAGRNVPRKLAVEMQNGPAV